MNNFPAHEHPTDMLYKFISFANRVLGRVGEEQDASRDHQG